MKKVKHSLNSGDLHAKVPEDQLSRYLQGKADRDEQYQLEAAAQEHPFLQEALDGFEEHPEALKELSKLNNIWHRRHTGNFRMKFTQWLVPGGIVIIASLLYLLFQSNPEPLYQASHSTLTPSLPIDSLSQPSVDSEQEPAQTSLSQLNSVQEITNERWQSELHHAKFTRKNFNELEPEQQNGSRTITEKSEWDGRIIYLHDLKIINYAPMLSRLHPDKKWFANGTDSRFENEYDKQNNPGRFKEDIREVSYVEYLDETMYLFNIQDYTEAKERFRHILAYHTEDLNAYFYSGLINYYSGNYEEALELFIRVKEDKITVFDEEAEWYEALCLEKLEHQHDCKELLHTIKQRNGFYAQRAAEKLNALP